MGKLKDFSTLVRSKKDLLVCIFVTLIIQISISFATMKFDKEHHMLGKRGGLLQSVILLIIMIALIFAMGRPNTSFHMKQILFAIFSIVVGLILSQVTYIINDPAIVEASVIATLVNLGLMLLLGIIIVYFKYDLEWIGSFLFIALLVIVVTRLLSLFSKDSKEINKKISMVSVIIFSLYILYDTNTILLRYKNNTSNCISGSLDYYLDIWNLFSNYLYILDN